MTIRSIFVLFLFIIYSCGQNGQDAVEVNAALMEVLPEPPGKMQTPPPPNEEAKVENEKQSSNPSKSKFVPKKIIKNGEMGISVSDIEKAKNEINRLLTKNKAYLLSENYRNTDTSESLSLVIRVPNQNFEALINSFATGIGEVIGKTIRAEDVTEEYTDVSIKLENKKIYLEKYRDMLKKATTTKDMLDIQENIRALEDEIDVAEGRLRFIDDRVNYSTLTLDLYKEKARSSSTSKIGFGSRFGDSIAGGWNSFVSFLLGLVSFWPFLILAPFIYILFKKFRNRRK
ncbi:DUF4349 domain-containing protein [Chryseobacterium sp. MP_3.2]|uniref:DUF4349 domain-containing protein n=1 Tax=Chryseobacterium sp. MP_3.2 TaxID=3071712 RepID=UPI002DF8AA09|nr:hypothetical protein [Chryseobacterium sp. MP_3.2]